MIAIEIPILHTAIARGAECDSRTNGPEIEMPRIATMRTTGATAKWAGAGECGVAGVPVIPEISHSRTAMDTL